MHRALSSAIWLVLAAGWSHAQTGSFPAALLPHAIESNDGGIELPVSMSPGLQLPGSFTFGGIDDQTAGLALADFSGEVNQPTSIAQVSESQVVSTGLTPAPNASRFQGKFSRNPRQFDVGTNLYDAPEFKGGLIVFGEDVAMKIGGYVKADFIYDFNPIDSTDSFVTTDIPVGAPARTNTRFHARQTRLSFDTRWASDAHPVRMFVEGDFFGDNNSYRLRHAYGEVGSLLVGQTWTTFTDVASFPATLDFEGSVSSVNRRQALIRWTQPVLNENWTMAIAAENPQFDVVPPPGITGDSRTPSPDLVARLRLSEEWGQYQIACLYRLGGFQPTDERVITGSAWGINLTGATLLTDKSKFYHQIVFGDGIGSYRGLPDAAPETATTDKVLGFTGWMVGITWDWNDRLSSNLTYAENALDNSLLQAASDERQTTYLAVNAIWNPVARVKVGIEYLYGLLETVDRKKGDAHRIQSALIFDLP
ncbi:DcaP family trimeric outer membrane transporter [Novipirellula artificiosorum]|uniref:Porin subfamily protein n=1 Tax=Novipirellula artificiosorum TaxID=2528016 RepID=A0A5C6D8K6_9BACT|nr:DcaP family trimeric outer membrane transporter [Novipirellula artificiosorum]TWU32037.1 Porin subfamily protein [Novipirellula artificiosorum]